MSTTEKAPPPAAAPDAMKPQLGDAAADAAAAEADGPEPSADAAPNASDTSDTLSPAVRRLVRQFDLDITGIHGTGPSGRIRVGDVMTLLGGRTDTGRRDAPVRTVSPDDDAEPRGDAVAEPVAASTERPAAVEPATHDAFPTTTVFDCDVSRVLAHRRRLRSSKVELLTTSYFVTALAAALETAPELAAGQSVRFGVSLTTADGRLRCSVLEVPETLPEQLDERVRAVDIALRANLHTPLAHATLLVHHYGESGSLLATPTPIGAGHAASVGIGRVRREIVVRVVDGVEAPRAAARCYLSISFFDGRVPFHRANRALADAVGILENWPD
jgi:2-oxoglutarate dehydrogenase E2 component (dihydrolipoamide succinyltransferase)